MTSEDAGALLSELKTGDLVLFAGQGLSSGLFKWLGRCAWTHVGLVLRGPGDAEPRLWEAGCEVRAAARAWSGWRGAWPGLAAE